MKPSRLVHWLRVSVMLALCSFTAYACGGSKFTATGGSSGEGSGGSGSTAGNGTGASAGTTVVNKVACAGPEDCDDRDPCTVDQCGVDGFCTTSPKCGATEQCCEGACGQCCENTDCDDGVTCTDDVCFAGGCSHSPDNTKCESNQYCSAVADCKLKEACADATGCDDGDSCTDDACSDAALCDHTATACANGELCCPGAGCAECCEDSQCNDDNPCTRDSCSANKCSHAALCEGQTCCPAVDNASATCGACCGAKDCNDGVRCTRDSCTQGTCAFTPDDKACEVGFACDAKNDCYQTAECVRDSDCKTAGCQGVPSCTAGKCTYAGCAKGTKCCANTNTCAGCCAATDCNDGIACTDDRCRDGTCSNAPNNGLCSTGIKSCDPASGGCIDCNQNSDCNDSSDCTVDTCDLATHKCLNKKTVCAAKGLLCCGTTCAACCGDSDCQGTTPPGIGTKCTYGICKAGVCGTTTTICSIGNGCCSYGCCGIKGPTPPDPSE